MEETRYMISDAAKKVDVETHVLRYWEEELELPISRTELGHRYYTEEDIHVFQSIKELKERGFQLKAIKVLLPQIRKRESRNTDHIISLEEKMMEYSSAREVTTQEEPQVDMIAVEKDKLCQFEAIVGNLFRQILRENNAQLEDQITGGVVKEMDLLMRVREEREEERYRRLDEMIRAHQKKRSHVAATTESGEKKRKWFGRR